TIGSGIFTVPGAVLRQSGGDVGVALVVWVVGSVLALLGALTFGELGAMLPDAGGSYVYVREAFGRLPAFLLGWTLFLAINTGSTATLAVAFANYLGELVSLTPVTHKLAGVAMIAAVTAVNIRGVRHAASVQNWSTALKVGAIFALAMAGFVLGDGPGGGRRDAPAVRTRGGKAGHAGNFGLHFQCRERARPHRTSYVLRDGAGWRVPPRARRGAPPLRHACTRRRDECGVGNGAGAERHIRAAVHVRRVRELDLRGARGRERVRAAPAAA